MAQPRRVKAAVANTVVRSMTIPNPSPNPSLTRSTLTLTQTN